MILRAACIAFLCWLTPALADGRAGDFDFYVLALSWSPTYCSSAGANPAQCDDEPPGFVVHGLWPQYESGYPDYCPTSEPRWLSDETVDAIRDVMPSASFARYQWQKHGMCSGLDEYAYFGLLLDAVGKVEIPTALDEGGDRLSPDEIETDFAGANPGLDEDGISVQCRSGRLTEVRICLTKELEFRDCAEVNADSCRTRIVSVPAAD